MTAILPHVKQGEAFEHTLAFPARRSNPWEDREEDEDEDDGNESSDSDDSRILPRTVTARAQTIPSRHVVGGECKVGNEGKRWGFLIER